MKTLLAQMNNANLEGADSSLSSLGSIRSRKRAPDWDSSSFSLSSTSNLDDVCKQLWLIRHGERMDEVATTESKKWRFGIDDKRLFDPPLTVNGFKQANERGKLLLNELSQIKRAEDYPSCIYVSPLERTLGTAYEIALSTKLPLVVVPGLCSCAAAVKRGGLIKQRVQQPKLHQVQEEDEEEEADLDDENEFEDEEQEQKEAVQHHGNQAVQNEEDDAEDDCELFLKDYGWIGRCHFLTKQEILQRFARNGVQIAFDYRAIEGFTQCVHRLSVESKRNTIVCVTHREGIRKLDSRLKRCHIPYCAVAKYACIARKSAKKKESYEFVYFEEE